VDDAGATPLEVAGDSSAPGLQHGFTIGVALLAEPAPAGIDTPEDLRRAERYWRATQGATT
jgi:hypothetical protein